MNAVDQAFILWEKFNQPRRASARTSACSNDPSCSGSRDGEKKLERDSLKMNSHDHASAEL